MPSWGRQARDSNQKPETSTGSHGSECLGRKPVGVGWGGAGRGTLGVGGILNRAAGKASVGGRQLSEF